MITGNYKKNCASDNINNMPSNKLVWHRKSIYFKYKAGKKLITDQLTIKRSSDYKVMFVQAVILSSQLLYEKIQILKANLRQSNENVKI